jgi:hypothetical protein
LGRTIDSGKKVTTDFTNEEGSYPQIGQIWQIKEIAEEAL